MSIHALPRRASLGVILLAGFSVLGLACSKSPDATTAPSSGLSFKNAPCSAAATVTLSAAQATRVDCSNGGTTVTLAGNGASYLVVAEFAVDQVPDAFVPYHLVSGTALGATASVSTPLGSTMRSSSLSPMLTPPLAASRTGAKQRAFTQALRARARRMVSSGAWKPSTQRSLKATAARSADVLAVPAVGSVRQFSVLKNSAGTAFTPVGARLAFAGNSVLVYIDTLAAANGFTSAQLQAFGALFDQTLYPIDTTAFGAPSDVDQNGRVIMLMSPAVNALTTSAECQVQGYVAGFFEEEDLGGSGSDPNSNHGEIFYSIAPDPTGASSCAHTAADVGFSVPSTFLHELQHLISFSQHVVIHGGLPEYGWLDEGLSIVAEELGSVYRAEVPGDGMSHQPVANLPRFVPGIRCGLFVRLISVRASSRHRERDVALRRRRRLRVARRRLAPHAMARRPVRDRHLQAARSEYADRRSEHRGHVGKGVSPVVRGLWSLARHRQPARLRADDGAGRRSIRVAQRAAALESAVCDLRRRVGHSAVVSGGIVPDHGRHDDVGDGSGHDVVLPFGHASDGDDRVHSILRTGWRRAPVGGETSARRFSVAAGL